MTTEKKKKKKNQKKLATLILLLFLTVIMLSTATYAWFTANKTVTVSSLDVKVLASSGLMISADAFNWKTVLSNADIIDATKEGGLYAAKGANQIPKNLKAVSSAGLINAQGFMEMFDGEMGEAADGSGAITVKPILAAAEKTGSEGNYIVFDLFLKSDAKETLYLTNNSSVVPSDGTADKGLKNAARVAFVIMGHATSETAYGDIQALNGKTANTSHIWEPNIDVHTQNAVNAASSIYGLTTITSGATIIPYDGAKAASPDAIKLAAANADASGAYFQAVAPAYKTVAAFGTPNNTESSVSMFELQPGVTKIRVYMYVEGQDIDCENNASGTDIAFNLQFSVNA